MRADAVRTWVRKQKTWGSLQHALIGVLALVAGILIVFLTFWLAYAVICIGWMGVAAVVELLWSTKLHFWREIPLIGSGVFIVLLFIQYFRTNPWDWGDYPVEDYGTSAGFAAHSGSLGGMAVMLAHPGASANMVADILLTGPRLVAGAWSLVAKGIRLRRLDENGCAELLLFLCGQARAVPYEELSAAGWKPWFGQLRWIEGVQFLQKGLVVSPELRQELAELK